MSAYSTSSGPEVRQCPTCNGTGINPVANYLLCPKCNGEKWLPYKRLGPMGGDPR